MKTQNGLSGSCIKLIVIMQGLCALIQGQVHGDVDLIYPHSAI